MSLITGYLVLMTALGLGRGKTHPPALSHSAPHLLGVCAWELLIFGVIFWGAWLASRATRDDFRLRWRGHVQPVLWGLGYSVALRFGIALVIFAAVGFLVLARLTSWSALQSFMQNNVPDVKALVDVPALRNDPLYFWLTVTVVSFVVAGVREELWRSAFLAGMKGVWPQYFSSRGGQFVAVLIGAVIFGCAHLYMGVLAAVMAGLVGVGLGFIMVWHRSIWPAVIAHGFFDATSFALLAALKPHLK